jgi:hypothetical protein
LLCGSSHAYYPFERSCPCRCWRYYIANFTHFIYTCWRAGGVTGAGAGVGAALLASELLALLRLLLVRCCGVGGVVGLMSSVFIDQKSSAVSPRGNEATKTVSLKQLTEPQ